MTDTAPSTNARVESRDELRLFETCARDIAAARAEQRDGAAADAVFVATFRSRAALDAWTRAAVEPQSPPVRVVGFTLERFFRLFDLAELVDVGLNFALRDGETAFAIACCAEPHCTHDACQRIEFCSFKVHAQNERAALPV